MHRTVRYRHPARPGFYRAKFRDQIDKHGLLGDIPPEVWAVEWNVNCQPAGDGSGALQYLAPYVFKVAIGEHRLGAPGGRQSPYRDGQRVCADGPRDHQRASGGPALPSVRGALRFSRLPLPGDSAIGSLTALGPRPGESSALSAVPAGP